MGVLKRPSFEILSFKVFRKLKSLFITNDECHLPKKFHKIVNEQCEGKCSDRSVLSNNLTQTLSKRVEFAVISRGLFPASAIVSEMLFIEKSPQKRTLPLTRYKL